MKLRYLQIVYSNLLIISPIYYPQTGPRLQYVLFSLPKKLSGGIFSFKPSEETLNDAKYACTSYNQIKIN